MKLFLLLCRLCCVVVSGISEMFKTPANERKRRTVIDESSATKTPVGSLSTSVVEPSVLNTPEEIGKVCVCKLKHKIFSQH